MKPIGELSGRELDYEVWRLVLSYPNERETKTIGLCYGPNCPDKTHGEAYANWARIPFYSTDLDAAWGVVEKMRSLSDGHFALLAFTTNWRAGFVTPASADCASSFEEFVEGRTEPEAICRAALAWVRARGESSVAKEDA